jgi:hypothetical protein
VPTSFRIDESSGASSFQLHARSLLELRFEDVRLEWAVSVGATDLLAPRRDLYSPRVDIAVGPFSLSPGHAGIDFDQIPAPISNWFEDLKPNLNPRCLIAVEVVYSGSAKHVLGDILNSSVLGLYGLVICTSATQPRVRRNLAYLQALTNVGKTPPLFQNVRVMTTTEFDIALGESPSAERV